MNEEMLNAEEAIKRAAGIKGEKYIYFSPWGQIEIPAEIYTRVIWPRREIAWRQGGHRLIVEKPNNVPENWPFWKFVHEAEVVKGKPDLLAPIEDGQKPS